MEKELKVCTKCGKEKDLVEFYLPKRSHCKDCERRSARIRMKRYNATIRGRAMQALNDSRKAVKKIEKETGRKIKNDLDLDRKSTRLNSSHVSISYAVFCLK